jgi:hypothetical protein
MFGARQEKGENVASWGSRIDEMQTDLREAARHVCKTEEIKGAIGLINHLGKACFIQGLHNERIQTIVHSRGESILISSHGNLARRGRRHTVLAGKIWSYGTPLKMS